MVIMAGWKTGFLVVTGYILLQIDLVYTAFSLC